MRRLDNYMKLDTFQKIKKEFGHYSSFAIWNEDNIDDLEVFEKNLKLLHGKIIFVAYNASAPIIKFQNFHKKDLAEGMYGWQRR